MRPEIERLLAQTDHDLENARKNLSIEAYEIAAFLAEQAVEKYLDRRRSTISGPTARTAWPS